MPDDETTEPRGADSMSLSELNDLIGSLTPAEMRMMLTDVARYRPEAFDRALAAGEAIMIPGGTHGHMHAVLDGLPPHAAVQAVAAEFPAWHLHESAAGWLWADTPCPAGGAPVCQRAPDAEHMWQILAAYEYRRHLAAIAHPEVTP